ncbi:hypothetical protein BDR04DRAFT_1106904 [Suillus decipiens]|nr:hypothetical protein BDR04DRAFT_1106904 [Suillus decipiens]
MAQSLLSSMKLARTSVLMHAIMDDHTMDNVHSFVTFFSRRTLLAVRRHDHRWLQLINFYLVIFFCWIFGQPVSPGDVLYTLIIKYDAGESGNSNGSSLCSLISEFATTALSLGLAGILIVDFFELVFHRNACV